MLGTLCTAKNTKLLRILFKTPSKLRRLAFTCTALLCFGVGVLLLTNLEARGIVFLDPPLRIPEGTTAATQIAAISKADPKADAIAAMRRGDRRFIGLLSVGPRVPPWGFWSGDARIILTAGCVLRTLDEEQLSKMAGEYATSYNLKLEELLTAK
jgi:hypothetical protein